VPVVRLVQTRVSHPEGEAMHLAPLQSLGCIDGQDPDDYCFRVSARGAALR
jgi:hypothetical protein